MSSFIQLFWKIECIYWEKGCRLKVNEISLRHGSFLHLGKEDYSNNFISSVALCSTYNARNWSTYRIFNNGLFISSLIFFKKMILYTHIGSIVCIISIVMVYTYFNINMPLTDLTIDIMAVDESCLKVS